MVATDVYTDSEIREDERMRKPLRMALYVKSTSIEDLQDPIKVISEYTCFIRILY